MKSKNLTIHLFIIILFGLTILASCNKNNDTDLESGNANISIKLGDSPAAYDAVNVEILKIRANINGSWIEYPVATPGVYNLLEFTNGNTLLLLGPTLVAQGSISELRLILGDNNSIVVEGVTLELKTPSGQSSGYKIKMESLPLSPGVVYSIVLDFDVNKSVHPAGINKYILNPVVRGYLEIAISKLSGTISPVNSAYYVNATNAADTAGTFINQSNGYFLINTLNPGTYYVHFYANPGYLDKEIYPVVITAGQTMELGNVIIEPIKIDE
jgi:hypothetical protein